MKLKINFINIFVILTSLISFLIIFYNYGNIQNGYRLVIVFPILYLILFVFTLGSININKSAVPVTTYLFIILQWLRFVLTPPMITISGNEAGTLFLHPHDTSLQLATMLMIMDLIASFLVLNYLTRKKINTPNKEKVFLKGNKYIYLLFIIAALAIYIVIGKGTNMLNFIIIPVDSGERAGDITSTPIVIARQIVLIAVFLVFLWSVSTFSKKYKQTSNKLYFYIPVIFALINVSLIVGERRSAQVYTAFCAIWILCHAYPHLKRSIVLSVGGIAATVLTFMSIYKFSGAFKYGSYLGAMQNSSLSIPSMSRTLQSYFAGPQDLAMIIEFSKISNFTLWNMIFDFLRSTVPISFFFKDKGQVTSEIFNNYIYNGIQSTGHVVSSTAYSYLYLGVLLSFFFSIINILIAYYFERKMKQSVSYEMMFVWGYVLIRFALNLTANTPALISSATIMLMTGGLLFATSKILSFRRMKKGVIKRVII